MQLQQCGFAVNLNSEMQETFVFRYRAPQRDDRHEYERDRYDSRDR